jgi:hypothetical protein
VLFRHLFWEVDFLPTTSFFSGRPVFGFLFCGKALVGGRISIFETDDRLPVVTVLSEIGRQCAKNVPRAECPCRCCYYFPVPKEPEKTLWSIERLAWNTSLRTHLLFMQELTPCKPQQQKHDTQRRLSSWKKRRAPRAA